MADDQDESLDAEGARAGRAGPAPSSDATSGDEQTLGYDPGSHDTVVDDVEVVDLQARYRVEATLGKGGMGVVLLATDMRLGRKVAIKRIRGEVAGNPIAVRRCLTEAKAIAALNHPNIVQIYDYGRVKDGPFLIMEYVDGGSLRDRCRGHALPLDEAIDIACQLCDGLAKAHDLGFIHRDIKPANVLVTKEGVPKLTDFGLAKVQTQENDDGETMAGAVLGTPDFMSPEQRRDSTAVDLRSDLWSLAATVYQMVTGRSPKVIRLHEVPQPLQAVMTRALEDAKSARYQSAREFRDALKTALRSAASATAVAAVGVGECVACGVQNDASRKFCRGCGASLVAPCLACTQPMPTWEEICGSCGAKQTPLADERRQALAARQAEAEGLLGDCGFDRATEIAAQLRGESHPKLGPVAAWANTFLERIETARTERIASAVESIREAAQHESAHDYRSAVATLRTIPESLRGAVLSGASESAARMLDRITGVQDEVRRLERLIAERVAAKRFDDLLPEVDTLLGLRSDRKDVRVLRGQLVERLQRQAAGRDEALATARAALASHDYEAATAALSGVAAALATPEVAALREQADGLVRQSRSLAQTIRQAVAAKQLDGLLETVRQYLELKPGDAEIARLRQSLVEREEKIAAEIAARLEQAEERERACRFDDAVRLLAVIPESRRSEAVGAVVERAGQLGGLRRDALQALARVTAGTEGVALRAGRRYRDALAEAGIKDPEFAAALAKVEATHEDDAQLRRIVTLAVRTAAGVAAVITIMWIGLWIRSTVRATSLASALAEERWDAVLAIDPGHAPALVGRARRKLEATPADAAGALEDLERAKRRSGDVEIARTARSLIAEAWLVRGRQAAAKGDAAALRDAVDNALAAGMSAAALAPLRARSLVLDAVAAQEQGDGPTALSRLLEASRLDAAFVQATLANPARAALRGAVGADHRRRFDEAVGGLEWERALQIAAAAETVDPSAEAWVAAAIAAVPPASLVSLPPATLATLPPAVMASLPPFRNSIGMELKLLPAGSFTMGEAGAAAEDLPHRVTLTKPFFIGVHEVTNRQWKRVMRDVPSNWKDGDRPVDQVSWEDAAEFCLKLSALPEERQAGREYRLPTEAEWEYACRAGTTSGYSFGDAETSLAEHGWFEGNANGQTHPVGRRQPNAWGLHDVHGNVWEWCSDRYGALGSGGATDPQGPAWASERVLRGGCWNSPAGDCRSARRRGFDPSFRFSIVGLRPAVSLLPAEPPETSR